MNGSARGCGRHREHGTRLHLPPGPLSGIKGSCRWLWAFGLCFRLRRRRFIPGVSKGLSSLTSAVKSPPRAALAATCVAYDSSRSLLFIVLIRAIFHYPAVIPGELQERGERPL